MHALNPKVALLLAALLAVGSGYVLNGACEYKNFPVFMGGDKDEFVYCSTIDE